MKCCPNPTPVYSLEDLTDSHSSADGARVLVRISAKVDKVCSRCGTVIDSREGSSEVAIPLRMS